MLVFLIGGVVLIAVIVAVVSSVAGTVAAVRDPDLSDRFAEGDPGFGKIGIGIKAKRKSVPLGLFFVKKNREHMFGEEKDE